MVKKFFIIFFILVASLCTISCSAELLAPKAGDKHPFVYINDEWVAGLRDSDGNIKSDYAASYKYARELAAKPLPAQPEGGYISASVSNQLVYRALMYALGEYDDEHAKDTVEFTMKYLEYPRTKETYSISMYKDYGTNAIQAGALVYDWCYNVLTEEQKQLLPKRIMDIYYRKEDTNGNGTVEYVQHCRPDNVSSWSDIAGYAVGQPLIYTSIAATALYDYNKADFFDVVMPKIQGTMAEAVKMYGTAGALSDGSMAYTREYYTYYVYMIFKRFGATDEQLDLLYGNQTPVGYKMLYARLPYGAFIKQGDDFYQPNYVMNTYVAGSETTGMGLLAVMYGDRHLWFQYDKQRNGYKTFLDFLTLDSELEPALPDDLPLAYETKEPRSEILARTSWQDGLNGPTVSAFLNMNERRTGDHDHGHVGEFQLYYKGPLTMPGGIYDGNDWGKPHWSGYYTRTSSANCMLIFDPSETFSYSNRTLSNDGSQRYAKYSSGGIFGTVAEHKSDVTRWATTENTYIGPNKQTPAFSYIKGDLKAAYASSKLDSYKRGMVFMDTFNETYPGVLIVFDKVVSKDKSFDKKWLLQAVADPVISGNKITITNTGDGANGKLVNTTLLPQDVIISKVGGIDKYFAGGVEYPAPVQSTASTAYRSGYRAEVSPAVENTEDIFLNAMFVTDADGNVPDLPMIYESTNEFVGVTTLDRTVLFAKSGETVNSSFTITVRDNNQGKDMLVLITDVANGKWTVSGNNTALTLESAKGDSCLTFSVKPGTYTISPANSAAALSVQQFPEAYKEKLGDFMVKYNTNQSSVATTSFMYLPDETYNKDGVPYVSAETAKQFDVDISVNGNTITIKNYKNVSQITVGDNFYLYNGDRFDIKNPAIIYNSKIYLPVESLNSAFGVSSSFNSGSKVLYVSKAKLIDTENLLHPEVVSGFNKASVLCDALRSESITFGDAGQPDSSTPLIYNFGNEPKDISKIVISGNVSFSSTTIYGSLDGVNYFKLYGSAEAYDKYSVAFNTNATVRYLKFLFPNKLNITEAAVYGTENTEKCILLDDKVTKFSLNSEFSTSVYLKSGFSNASLYIGDENVYTFNDNGNGYYKIELSTADTSVLSKGITALKVVADYNGETITKEREIELFETNSKVIVSEDFNASTLGAVFKSKGSYYFSRNAQNATESLSGGSYILTFNKPVTSSSPFIYANGFSYGSGVYEIKMNIEISSPKAAIGLELRDKNGSYPPSGPGVGFISRLSGNLEVNAFLDSRNSLLRIFAREAGSNGEMVLVGEHSFTFETLGQFRFTLSSFAESAVVSFDNIEIIYHYEDAGCTVYPESGKVITDEKVMLSAYAEDADEVIFCINDEVIKTFAASSDGIYEYETTFEKSGVKNFDVYVLNGDKITLNSKCFNYNPNIKRGLKAFSGPFTPKLQNDGTRWINVTSTESYFTGRVVFEGDLTITSAEDEIKFELGGASDYDFVWGGKNYITLYDALGYSSPFFKNGKILDTDFSYELNKPMHIKYVCDTDKDMYELYIDGKLVKEKAGDGSSFGSGNLVAAKIVGCKVRLHHNDVDGDGDGAPVFANVRTYQEIPGVCGKSITYGEKNADSGAGYIIPKGAESFEILLDEEYETLDETLVFVTLNGKEIDYSVNYNKETGTLMVYGLNLDEGHLKVLISGNAKRRVFDKSGKYVFDKANPDILINIYVGNSNSLYILPEKSFGNKTVLKYVNGGNSSKNTLLTAAKYSEDIIPKLVDFRAFVGPVKKGAGILHINSEVSSVDTEFRIWSEKFEPIY